MELFLLISGIILIFLELFSPSGIIGLIGFISFIAGIYLVSPNIYYAISILSVSVILFIILFIFMVKINRKNIYTTLFLKTRLNKDDGFLSSNENNKHLGEIMISDTFLRPSGKVKKDGIVYDAISEGEFIEKNLQVEVLGNRGYILIVKKFEN